MVVKNAFDVPIGTLWGKPFSYWTKRNCVCLVRTINETSSGSWQNSFSFWLCFFNRFVTTPFYLSWRQFRGAFFVSEKTFVFSDVFRHWLKTVRAFVKFFRTGLPRLLATSPEEPFRDKCIFWRTLFSFESSPTLGEKFHQYSKKILAFWLYYFGRLSKLTSTSAIEQFEGKFIPRKKL